MIKLVYMCILCLQVANLISCNGDAASKKFSPLLTLQEGQVQEKQTDSKLTADKSKSSQSSIDPRLFWSAQDAYAKPEVILLSQRTGEGSNNVDDLEDPGDLLDIHESEELKAQSKHQKKDDHPKNDVIQLKDIEIFNKPDIVEAPVKSVQKPTPNHDENIWMPARLWSSNDNAPDPEVIFVAQTERPPFHKESPNKETADDDLLPEEQPIDPGDIKVAHSPMKGEIISSKVDVNSKQSSMEDVDYVYAETQIQPNPGELNIRYRRETCPKYEGCGDFKTVAVQVTFNKDLKNDNDFKRDLSAVILRQLNSTVFGEYRVIPILNINEPDAFKIENRMVEMEIMFENTSYHGCYEMNTNQLTLSVAKALLKLDKLQVGSEEYIVSNPKVRNNSYEFSPAMCLLCAYHHHCVQRPTKDWFCQFYNDDFYPFSTGQTMPRDKELASVKINITYFLPFGNKLFDAVWISVNGLISFGFDNSSFTPNQLPVDSHSNLLAVYWSDLDLISGDERAEIYYQLHTKNTTNKAIFDMANSDVVKNSEELKSYEATSILVVTWVEVPAHQSSDERVSFQCVVVTDGFTTFAMYRYTNGAMRFDPYLARPVVVGWGETNFDTQMSSYYMFDMVTGNRKDMAIGSWFFKVGGTENYHMKCQNWYLANKAEKEDQNQWLKALPDCPCSENITMSNALWNKTTLDQCYDTVAIYGDFGMRCCYRGGGNFENRPRLAGAFQRYNALGNNKSAHILNDVLPYSWCCEQSDLCEKYYEVRPISTCNSNSFERALLFGDPHIITIDQKSFIFNGLGEYRVLEIQSLETNFIMQGRTCRAVYNNGTLTSATVWCALTFKTTRGDKFSVAMNTNKTSLIIYVNRVDVSTRFNEQPYFYDHIDNMILKKLDNSLQVVTTTDYITVTVRMANQMLEFTIDLPKNFKRMTKGLLGNFNDLDSDDYILPNGTTLPNNSKERLLFEYGNTWRVVDSIFVYSYGQNTSTFYDPKFKPFFLDENLQFLEEASKVCNGQSNLPCLFDYIATRNAQVANSSAKAVVFQAKIVSEKEQKRPLLTQVSNVHVSENSTIIVPGYTADGQSVTCKNISGSNYILQTFNATSCEIKIATFSFTQEVIAISTVVQTGIESTVVQIPLTFCGCKNGGQCDYNNTRKAGNSVNLLALCICDLGYSGLSCELDKDGCASRPCPNNCTDVPAERERTTGQAYQCGNCHNGFALNQNKTKCEDINECIASNSCGPNSRCVNTIGSFYCLCSTGFRLSERNKSLCVDINECTENTNKCVQKCFNTPGSYLCQCEPGYTAPNCTKNADPCASLNATCEHDCRNVNNKAECFCRKGYRLKNETHCEDINECDENLCSQNCVNTVGSYICSCFAGYNLTGPQTCVECPGATYGFKCSRTCNCRGRAESCDKVKGCVCRQNWRGENCEIDVNECVEEPSKCRPDQDCKNTLGSYSCDCEEGYEEVNGTCSNIDECKSAILNSCQQICVDTLGSYVCECKEGYTKTGNSCTDIDECLLGSSQCQQTCTNNIGSYSCGCLDGYTLTDDRRTCFRDLDLCNNTYINCSQGCTLNNKTALCFCSKGFRLATNNADCIDIDECKQELHNCFNNESCINQPGTYSCNCPEGYKLQNDMRSCQPCDMYHWGPGCSNDCSCSSKGTNVCHPITGCVCREGWDGDRCQNDINECNSNTTRCPENSLCINTVGSYNCQCRNGYVYSKKTCIDINECEMYAPCEQQCENTPGSYKCSCKKGFYVYGDKCLDTDECGVQELNNCEQSCRNTIGGFACECYDGYILNTTTRNTCYLESDNASCRNSSYCDHYCVRSGSNEVCSCKPGYALNADNRTCNDVDECRQEDICINGTCLNRNGSFACACNDSFKLLPDRTTCKVCDPWSYGKNCSGVCTCDRENTISCDPLTARCKCLPGWINDNCTHDVNECELGLNNCSANSQCVNIPGSYRCICNIGFYSTGDFSCKSCATWKYGVDCSSQCVCVSNNTVDCNDVTGDCTCRSGWTGTNCGQDIDECINSSSSYCLGSHEKCFNLNGTAECRCLPGYERKFNQTLCTDVDECFDPILTNCTSSQDCQNTEGSFYCVCKSGYKQLNNICQVNFRQYTLGLRLDYPNNLITQDLFDNTSKDFVILATEIEKQLLYLYNGTTGAFLPPKVIQFSYGSLKADILLRLDLNYSHSPVYDVSMYAHRLQSADHFVIGNLSVPILNITVNDQPVPVDPCELYKALKKTCSAEDLCVEDTTTTQCHSTPVSGGTKKDLIIGLTVGIPLGVGLIVLIIIIVCTKRKRRLPTADGSSSPSFDGSSITRGFISSIPPRRSDASADLYSPVFKSSLENEPQENYLPIPGNKPVPHHLSWSEGSSSQDLRQDESNNPASSFSWDRLQTQLDNTKEFQIQRPAFSPAKLPKT